MGDDETDRVPRDAPFRRMIIDPRIVGPGASDRIREVLARTLGQRSDAGSLTVFVTRFRGGGPQWFVLAAEPQGGEIARTVLMEVEAELTRVLGGEAI